MSFDDQHTTHLNAQGHLPESEDTTPKCICCGRPLTIEDRLMNLEFLICDAHEQVPQLALNLVDTMIDMVIDFRELHGLSDDEEAQ